MEECNQGTRQNVHSSIRTSCVHFDCSLALLHRHDILIGLLCEWTKYFTSLL